MLGEMFGLNERETCCAHEYKDLNTNRTKNGLESSCSICAFSLQDLLTNTVTIKCINKDLALFRHGFAVEPHQFHMFPRSCKDSHDLHLLSISWNKCFCMNRRCTFPKRITTDEIKNECCVRAYSQKLQNFSHIQICHVMKLKETHHCSLSCLFCIHNFVSMIK